MARHTDENGATVFSAFVFVFAFALTTLLGVLAIGEINIWVLLAAVLISTVAILTFHIAMQWENVVILRFGRYNRTKGPGFYVIIPFIEYAALRADQRMMITAFSAEETLTSDVVPLNVDAVLFWMVWDAKKACTETEDYYDSVSLVAQTALRDAIGRAELSDVVTRRVQLDEELRAVIDEKTAEWGVSVLSVEIRDIVVPKMLQESMAAEAAAMRQRNARVILAEIEEDISELLHNASAVYREDELAFKLRHMLLLSESVRESNGSVVVPSAYAEGFGRAKSDQPSTVDS